jgi:hypothetical protein
MIGTLLVIAAVPLVGLAAGRLLWRDAELERAEEALSAIVLGFTLWMAATWLLALTGTLTTATVHTLAALFIALATTGVRHLKLPQLSGRTLLLGTPLALWTGYILWRGWLLPPSNHDAVAYHYTRAILLARNHGFARFVVPDGRVDDMPANYELLLSQVILGTGSDRVGEWVSVAFFVALLVAVVALVQRWWTSSAPAAEAVLAVAATPVALLHSGADKNDLMTNVFCVAAILWGSRWAVSGGRAPLLLVVLSIGLAVGTKPTAGVVVAAVALLLVLGLLRRGIAWRGVAATAAAGVLAFVLLGGAAYVANYRATGSVTGASVAKDEVSNGTSIGYGDYANLLRVPYLALTVPFSKQAQGVWVPWRGEYWWWPRYEIFSAHYGVHFTLIVLALPFMLRAKAARPEERRYAAIATAVAFLLFLPLQTRPLGFFNAILRYTFFVVPVVCALVFPPLLTRSGRWVQAVRALVVIFFCFHAVEYGAQDRFTPFRYAWRAAAGGGTRLMYFKPERAETVVDRIAGPNDTIAIVGGFDSWTYPAYGAELSRKVVYLPATATAQDVPAEVRWVAIDRGWRIIWGDPTFEHMGQFSKKISRGRPAENDLRMLRSLVRDCHFRLVYYDSKLNQSVFVRTKEKSPRGCPEGFS